MMKKLLCFLVILFLIPAAYAQEAAPYKPGSATTALFADAFERGEMVFADMNWAIDFSENAPEILDSDSDSLDLLSEVLQCSTLTIGVGKIEDGLRIPLTIRCDTGDQQAELDLTLDLTAQGVRATSSLLPGECLSVEWTTLMQLSGVSPEQLAPLQTLDSADTEAALAELAAQLAPLIEMVAQIAAPYGQTLLTHIAALPIEVLENVPADGAFPAAALEINVTITEKALGELFIALSDQLAADATLCAIVDAALAQSGESITAAQLCQAIRISGEEMTDESLPLYLCIGLSDTQSLLYFSAYTQNASEEAAIISFITSPDADMPGRTNYAFGIYVTDAAGEVTDGIDLSFSCGMPTDVLPIDLAGELSILAEGELVFTSSAAFAQEAAMTADAQRMLTYAHLERF